MAPEPLQASRLSGLDVDLPVRAVPNDQQQQQLTEALSRSEASFREEDMKRASLVSEADQELVAAMGASAAFAEANDRLVVEQDLLLEDDLREASAQSISVEMQRLQLQVGEAEARVERALAEAAAAKAETAAALEAGQMQSQPGTPRQADIGGTGSLLGFQARSILKNHEQEKQKRATVSEDERRRQMLKLQSRLRGPPKSDLMSM
jgi:hypothetical protein